MKENVVIARRDFCDEAILEIATPRKERGARNDNRRYEASEMTSSSMALLYLPNDARLFNLARL